MDDNTTSSRTDDTDTRTEPGGRPASAAGERDRIDGERDSAGDGAGRTLAPGRRDVLRAIGGTAVAGLAWGATTTASAAGAPFGDGVNLMPSYYCSGDQELGWDLMGQHEDIQSVRIEIEPFSFDEVVTTRDDAKRWIDEAYANGYDVIATYHHYPDNGSADPQALQNAADFWAEHYAYLSQDASFTINLMNEWGNHQVTADEYATAYDDAIGTVRNQTSYDGSIICDAPGWGQGTHVVADAAQQIADDDLILSAHVYGDGWNERAGENLQPEHLDVMDETDYPCMVGEFGANRPGQVDWEAVIDHANELGWPVFAWAWNGDGADDPMNMADPAWMNDCSATSYTTSAYFDEMYPKLQGGGSGTGTGTSGTGGGDATPPTVPTNLATTATGTTTVDVSWSPASDTGGSGLDHYVVFVDGSQDHTVAAGTTETTIAGLSAGTSYQVTVSAVDGAGNESEESNAVTATTDPTGSGTTTGSSGSTGSGGSDDDSGGWWGSGSSGGSGDGSTGGWWGSSSSGGSDGGSDGSGGWW